MRLRILFQVLVLTCTWTAFAQEPEAQSAAAMEAILNEARELEATQLQEAQEKLAPLLEELRLLHESDGLTSETTRIYRDALLLQIGIQTKLLAPEEEIVSLVRSLLVIHPMVDESLFNPRQRLLVDRVRALETGRLTLQVQPPGSTLFYLGESLGETPIDVPLVAGSYKLLLRKEGFRDQEFEVVVNPSEILMLERTLRRNAVDVPVSLNTVGATIRMNGRLAGQSQDFDSWVSSLPAGSQAEMRSIVGAWNVDPKSSGFFMLEEVPVGEQVTLEFRAPCYELQTLELTVSEEQIDWTRALVDIPELRQIELVRETGFMEITSTPPGADVWIDGALQGKTPLGVDVCAGTRRVQVLHRSGQYIREVILRRGQVTKVSGELRPALAFLGLYRRGAQDEPLAPMRMEWESVARQLALRCTAFINPQVGADELESQRKTGAFALERLLAGGGAAADTDSLVKKIADDAGRVNMILFGIGEGGRYEFRLFNTIHPTPDIIALPDLQPDSLDFLTSQLNKAERVRTRIQVYDLGISLLDTQEGLAVTEAPEDTSGNQGPVVPGAIITTVDRQKMTLKELQAYLQTKEAGESVTLGIASGGQSAETRAVPVRFFGREYPWGTPDGFPNSVLVMLHHLVERDPASDEAKYASLSLATGLMQQAEWKLALEILAKTNLEPHNSGVCPGTVLYYQGRCYEALGENSTARNYYSRAKDFTGATLATPYGLSVPALAERRLQSLKN